MLDLLFSQNLWISHLEELDIDTDSLGLPLVDLCINFYPYKIYSIRPFFGNNFFRKNI